MATVITHSTGVITPEVVNGFESERETRTIVHTIIGREDPDITLRPAGLRTGTLTLVFATGAQATAAEIVLSFPQLLALADPDVPEVAMSFVVPPGRLAAKLDPESRRTWLLEVPFQEVAV